MREMGVLRRALLFASGGRYVMMVINLASTAALARLLTPMQFGITVLGTAILGIAEALRELGSIAYLVQQKELTLAKTRTMFTVNLIVTLSLATVLLCLSDILASFYAMPELARYIRVVAITYAIAPFSHPMYALLSRDLEFHKLAAIDVSTTLVGAVSAICLALLGFSYMSLAWGGALGAATWTALGFYVRRDFSIYRPCLSEWRSVLSFGAYGSATAVLYKLSESLFYLLLGKVLHASAAAVCQRALLLTQFPERVVLAGISAVALPAFSNHARQGQDVKAAYLNAIEHVTAVLWPALLLLGILADPIVAIVLGPQWHEVVPILQIFTMAYLFNFPTSLNYPVQVAVGAIRHTVPLAFVQTAVTLSVLSIAASHGVRVVALCTLFTMPLNVGLSVCLVRRHVPFRIGEFISALKKSFALSVLSAVGPAVVMLLRVDSGGSPVVTVAAAVAVFGGCWIGGLWLTRHPLFPELRHVGWLVAAPAVARLPGKLARMGSFAAGRLPCGVWQTARRSNERYRDVAHGDGGHCGWQHTVGSPGRLPDDRH
jgi:O-antigen/teichoic acid export membrane protein